MNRFMFCAIDSALKGIQKNAGGPFGACIIRGKKVIAVAHNCVLKNQDPTCHAEIQAIQIAAKKIKSFDLSDCQIYSTTEPCPMCFAAIHWARISHIVYGTSIADVAKLGFNELAISNHTLKKMGRMKIKIKKNFARKACLQLLKEWSAMKNKRVY